MKKDFPLSEIIEALEDNEINEKEINEILSNSIERKSM